MSTKELSIEAGAVELQSAEAAGVLYSAFRMAYGRILALNCERSLKNHHRWAFFQAKEDSTVEQIITALAVACHFVADAPQQYHEANTPDGWAMVFLEAARTGRTPDQVIADAPAAKDMTPGYREAAMAQFAAVDTLLKKAAVPTCCWIGCDKPAEFDLYDRGDPNYTQACEEHVEELKSDNHHETVPIGHEGPCS